MRQSPAAFEGRKRPSEAHVDRRVQRLDRRRDDVGVLEGKGLEDRSEKGGPVCAALHEPDAEVGPRDGDGDPRQAAAGAEVVRGSIPRPEAPHRAKGIENVTLEEASHVPASDDTAPRALVGELRLKRREHAPLFGAQMKAQRSKQPRPLSVGHRDGEATSRFT